MLPPALLVMLSVFEPWIEVCALPSLILPDCASSPYVSSQMDTFPSWMRLCSRSQAMVCATYSSLLKLLRAWIAQDEVAVVQIQGF